MYKLLVEKNKTNSIFLSIAISIKLKNICKYVGIPNVCYIIDAIYIDIGILYYNIT
jgi:hypothetical protein